LRSSQSDQAPSSTTESKALRLGLAILFRACNHQTPMRLSDPGASYCQLNWRRNLNQNSRLNMQPASRWSSVSGPWLQRAQRSLSRKPCLNSMPAVQERPCSTDQKKKRHFPGAFVFHNSLAPKMLDWPTNMAK
jgi:hypothetical protein